MSATVARSERGGKWMPFRFLYFIYYVFCKRDQMRWPQLDRPAIGASGFLVFVLGWPIYALLNLVDRFTGWVHIAKHWWLALDLPVLKHNPDATVFVIVVVAVDLAMCAIVFSKSKRYAWIMSYFSTYEVTGGAVPAGIILMFPLFVVMVIAIISTHASDLFDANLTIWVILICTELVFRGWWRLFLMQKKSESPRRTESAQRLPPDVE